jgi:hypothetical protein
MSDHDNLIDECLKLLRAGIAQPQSGQMIFDRIAKKLEQASLTPGDLHIFFGEANALKERDRALAAEAAIPSDWDAFAVVAGAKGYRTILDISKAVGESKATLNSYRNSGWVPRKLMLRLNAAQDNPKKADSHDRTSIQSLIAQAKLNLPTYHTYRSILLERIAKAGGKSISYLPAVTQIRDEGGSLNDHLAKVFAKTLQVEKPDIAGKIRYRDANKRRWEHDWRPEMAMEIIAAYRDWLKRRDVA